MSFARLSATFLAAVLIVGSFSTDSLLAQDAEKPNGVAHAASNGTSSFSPTFLPRLTVPRLTSEIVIDGEMEEDAWSEAGIATGFSENYPDEQQKPPIGIKAFMTYDDDHLYIGYRIKDDPSQVRARYSDRDQIWQDDYVGIILDTKGDGQRLYFIAANPFGIQGDTFISGDNEDLSFNMLYESAGRITDSGYQVEFAIPFSSLRFPAADVQEWRATFWITHPRDSRNTYSWAAIDRDDPCLTCQYGFLDGLENVTAGNNLWVLPSVTGFQSATRTGSDADASLDTEPVDVHPALDIKYGITSDLTADLTINPDFSQIESDAAQIDANTTFALFYDERRTFFQEGSELFDTKINAVYTRTINEPIAAAKLTGRVGNLSIGYIGARDENSPVLLPFAESSALAEGGKSFSNILRGMYSFGNNSFLGGMITDRRLDGGGTGSLAAIDGSLRFLRLYTFAFQTAVSHTLEPDRPDITPDLDGQVFGDQEYTATFDGESFEGYAFDASLGRGGRHWQFDVTYRAKSPTFRADNGFVTQNDTRRIMSFQSYTFYPSSSFIERITPRVMAMRRWDFDGNYRESWASVGLNMQFKAQTSTSMTFGRSNEIYQGSDFSDKYYFRMEARSNFSQMLSAGMEVWVGESVARNADVPYIGNRREIAGNLTLRAGKRLVISPRLVFSDLKHPDTGVAEFSGYIARARTTYQFTRKLLARVIVQYNDFSESLEVDPLVTFRVGPFTVFHVGSTHRYLNIPGSTGEQNVFAESHRQIFFKFQYLFQK